jgi:hypothetical protein
MTKVDAGTLREISVEASVDPRSVKRVLNGEHIRGMADARIRKVLHDRGIEVEENKS